MHTVTSSRIPDSHTVYFIRYVLFFKKLQLKSNLYSVIKSEDSEVLDGGTSQLGR